MTSEHNLSSGNPERCPGCELNAYADDDATTVRRGRRWHWPCAAIEDARRAS